MLLTMCIAKSYPSQLPFVFQALGWTPALHALFPLPEQCPPPFATAVHALYRLAAHMPLVWTDAQVRLTFPKALHHTHTAHLSPPMAPGCSETFPIFQLFCNECIR